MHASTEGHPTWQQQDWQKIGSRTILGLEGKPEIKEILLNKSLITGLGEGREIAESPNFKTTPIALAYS